jgi:hypothetical protein
MSSQPPSLEDGKVDVMLFSLLLWLMSVVSNPRSDCHFNQMYDSWRIDTAGWAGQIGESDKFRSHLKNNLNWVWELSQSFLTATYLRLVPNLGYVDTVPVNKTNDRKLSPSSRLLLWKLIVVQVVKKFPVFSRTKFNYGFHNIQPQVVILSHKIAIYSLSAYEYFDGNNFNVIKSFTPRSS